MNWYIKVLKQYTRFHGRARRKEYWYFTLINLLIYLSLTFIAASFSQQFNIFQLLPTIYNLGVFLPSLAVTIRRLHDTGRSGWWLLIGIIPIVGGLILLSFSIDDSEPGLNRFGRNPKESPD